MPHQGCNFLRFNKALCWLIREEDIIDHLVLQFPKPSQSWHGWHVYAEIKRMDCFPPRSGGVGGGCTVIRFVDHSYVDCQAGFGFLRRDQKVEAEIDG